MMDWNENGDGAGNFTKNATEVSTVHPRNITNDMNNDDTSYILTYFTTIWFLVFFIIGIITNLLSFFIIVKQGLIKSSIWVYIAALCISDICCLIIGFIYEFSKSPLNLLRTVMTRNSIACKIMTILYYTGGSCSHYILSTITVSRCLLIVRPYSQPSTPKQALGYVCLIVVVIFLLYGPFLAVTYDVIEIPSYNNNTQDMELPIKLCMILPKYSKLQTYFGWIDMTIIFIIPVGTMLISNGTIIVQLYKRSKLKHINRIAKKSLEDIKISYMLVVTSLFFILCISPNIIYYTIAPYIYDDVSEAFAPNNIIWIIIVNISVLAYSCNFFLYAASGKLFRSELRNLFQSVFKRINSRNSSNVNADSPYVIEETSPRL